MNKEYFTKDRVADLVNKEGDNLDRITNQNTPYILYVFDNTNTYQVTLVRADNKSTHSVIDELIFEKTKLKTKPFGSSKGSLFTPIINMLSKHNLLEEKK